MTTKAHVLPVPFLEIFKGMANGRIKGREAENGEQEHTGYEQTEAISNWGTNWQ